MYIRTTLYNIFLSQNHMKDINKTLRRAGSSGQNVKHTIPIVFFPKILYFKDADIFIFCTVVHWRPYYRLKFEHKNFWVGKICK